LAATKKENKLCVCVRERERERETTGSVKRVCFQREKKMKTEMIAIIIVEEGKRKEKRQRTKKERG